MKNDKHVEDLSEPKVNRDWLVVEFIELIINGKAKDQSKIEVLKDLFGYYSQEEDDLI